jgi:hypothetical protein
MSDKIPFVWTNDDIQNKLHHQFEPMQEFLARFDLKGTFFVVPCPEGKHQLTDDARLVELLHAAQRDGHDLQQHSTTHVCIENGTADLRMFDLMGDAAKVAYSQNRFVHERLWQVDALEAQIGWGRQVWIDAMGEASPGFRPGCGSFCGNMYRALENLGFKWCSARMVSMTGWMRAAGHWDYPRTLEGPVMPSQQGGIIEFPILDDVCFRIPRARVNEFVELGWQHWQECVERKLPFVLVSHPFGLEHLSDAEYSGTGYEVHEKLLPRILESGHAAPMTLTEYYDGIERGLWPMAAPENDYPGEDQIPEWHIWSRTKQE